MAKRKKRKTPGVVIIKPNPKFRTGWRVRYRDPLDNEKVTTEKLDHDLTTDEARNDYAYKLSVRLARQRRDMEEGRAMKKTCLGIGETIELHFKAHPDLRERTLKEYRNATGKLVAWCETHGVKTADELDKQNLMAFREHLINEPKRRSVYGGKRGQRESAGERKAPRTINKQLTHVGTALRYLVKREAFSRLNLEAVIVATEHYRAKAKAGQSTAARPLSTREIEHLLEACIEHDEQTFALTREEKAAGAEPSTLRYEPIGPLVAFVLLTGMRVDSEALRIEWPDVDFDRDVIHVGTWSKTGKTRDVTLGQSPILRRILDAQHEITGGKGKVWPMTYAEATSARKRLIETYNAPDAFSWQALRKTCQSFLASSPNIYGAASVFLTAKRGGHSVAVCERVYANAVKVADPDATTIEGVMGVQELLDQIAEDLEGIEVAA